MLTCWGSVHFRVDLEQNRLSQQWNSTLERMKPDRNKLVKTDQGSTLHYIFNSSILLIYFHSVLQDGSHAGLC